LLPGSELMLNQQATQQSGVVYTRFVGAGEGEYLFVSPKEMESVISLPISEVIRNFQSFKTASNQRFVQTRMQ